MTSTIVEVRGLSRRFGATRARDGVELAIPEGRVFGLVGENGAGKTTLIKHVLGQKVRGLSRGQQAKAGLVLALAHRPPLLVLAEPSSGLDPVVRRDMLGAIIRTVTEEGRTGLFSSHLLDEVERVADHVAMLHQGKVVLDAPLEAIHERHWRVSLTFEEPSSQPPRVPGVLSCEGEGREWAVVYDGDREHAHAALAATGGRIVGESSPSLDEIFVSRVKG